MHPLLFQIPLDRLGFVLGGQVLWLGALEVPAFGALLGLGVLLGGAVTLRLAGRVGLERESVLAVVVSALFAGLLGARLGFVLLHPSAFGSVAEALSPRAGGLSGVAGIATGVAFASWAARRRGLPGLVLLDAAAPGFALGVALTRLGCFLEGCDFGTPLSASAPRFLARLGTFPARSPAWVEQVSQGLLGPNAVAALPVHPSDLYECLAGLVLFVLALVHRPRSRAPGDVALVVLAGYFVLRVLVDLTRPASSDVWGARAALVLAVVLSVWRPWPRATALRP